MSLPRQVQAQLEEIERIEQEMAAGQPAETQDPQASQEPQGEQPAEPVAEAIEPPAPVAEPQQSDEETWQRRFQTLQGKYNAEVPRLTAEVRDLKAQLDAALARVNSLAEEREQPKQTQQTLVTSEDVEAFGPDLVDLIHRKALEVARQELSTEIAALKDENAKLLNRLDGVTERQGMSDREAYFGRLSQEVPDFAQINEDQRWLDWLMETDPLSGQTRQTYLDDAFLKMDVSRTAALFNTFKQQAGIARQAQPAQPPKDLQRQVAPGTSRASVSEPAGNDKIWSTSEMEQFYKDVARGVYRGREAEQVRIEAEIDAAVATNRIRP